MKVFSKKCDNEIESRRHIRRDSSVCRLRMLYRSGPELRASVQLSNRLAWGKITDLLEKSSCRTDYNTFTRKDAEKLIRTYLIYMRV